MSSFASGNAKVPYASSFASQWNIGFIIDTGPYSIMRGIYSMGITQAYGDVELLKK